MFFLTCDSHGLICILRKGSGYMMRHNYQSNDEPWLHIDQHMNVDNTDQSIFCAENKNILNELVDIDDDLEKNKDFIKEILANEIVSRYYYQKGRIQSSLNYDKDILQAISILSDSHTTYNLQFASIYSFISYFCFLICEIFYKNSKFKKK